MTLKLLSINHEWHKSSITHLKIKDKYHDALFLSYSVHHLWQGDWKLTKGSELFGVSPFEVIFWTQRKFLCELFLTLALGQVQQGFLLHFRISHFPVVWSLVQKLVLQIFRGPRSLSSMQSRKAEKLNSLENAALRAARCWRQWKHQLPPADTGAWAGMLPHCPEPNGKQRFGETCVWCEGWDGNLSKSCRDYRQGDSALALLGQVEVRGQLTGRNNARSSSWVLCHCPNKAQMCFAPIINFPFLSLPWRSRSGTINVLAVPVGASQLTDPKWLVISGV